MPIKRLLEIFKDVKPVIRGKSNNGKYTAYYQVVPKPDGYRKYLRISDIKRYVEDLQRRYPDKDFKYYVEYHEGKRYVVISRPSHYKDLRGNLHEVTDRVPIYIDLKEQRFYVPASYVKKRRRLAYYIIMRTLGALGISTVKYLPS